MFNVTSAHSAAIFYSQIVSDAFGRCSPAASAGAGAGSGVVGASDLLGKRQPQPVYVVKNHPLPLTVRQTLEIKVIISLFAR